MVFDCLQCGECCSYLGQVHTLVKQISDTEFLVRNEYTNVEDVVTLDPDKTEWFADRSIYEMWPEACPFLRRDPNMPGRICCSVHLTRPEMCRSYGCWRVLILDGDGKLVGRIMGPHFLRSEDEELHRFWDEHIKDLKCETHKEWDKKAFEILERHGYLITDTIPADIKERLDIACGISRGT